MLNFNKKPIIAMLHLMSNDKMSMLERMKRETEIYFNNGIDAVLVENYFGSATDCEAALAYLQTHYRKACYGVNILGDYKKAFALSEKYDADFIQIDSVCGHLPPKTDSVYAADIKSLMSRYNVQVLGGVRFKYQPVQSGRTLEEDLRMGKERCTAVVTTGDGTGQDCPTEKLREFRGLLGDFPLIVGAGVTAKTVAEKIEYSNGAIVGSWFKDEHNAFGDVCEEYVREFMESIKQVH